MWALKRRRAVRTDEGNACRFPRPCAPVPCISVRPVTTKGQRTARRGRSARPKGGADAGRGLWGRDRSSTHTAGGGRGVSLRHGRGGQAEAPLRRVRADHETHAFPRPGAGRGPDQQSVPVIHRPAPAEGGAGAGPRLGATAGPGPIRRGWHRHQLLPWERGVSIEAPRWRFRAEKGNATRVSSARARRCPVGRWVHAGPRPAPDPAGEKRPPWAGRALAVAFGGHRRIWTNPAGSGRGVGLCHGAGGP